MKTTLVSPFNKLIMEKVDTDGWSWEAFLLGPIWYLNKGMWGKGFLYLFIGVLFSPTIIIPVALWLAMAIKFNSEYYEYLLKQGYKEANNDKVKQTEGNA